MIEEKIQRIITLEIMVMYLKDNTIFFSNDTTNSSVPYLFHVKLFGSGKRVPDGFPGARGDAGG